MKHARKTTLLLYSLFLLLCFLAFREFLQINVLAYVGSQNIWQSRRFITFLIISGISITILAVLIIRSLKGMPISPGVKTLRRLPPTLHKVLALLLVALPPVIFWFLPLPPNFEFGYWVNLFLMYTAALASAWLWPAKSHKENDFLLRTSVFWLTGGFFYAVFNKLVYVTDYPFTLYWSEGNRFFDYSTLFGGFRYIQPQGNDIFAFIKWGMQLPWAVPFIFPNLSIRIFRFWYQLVWILPSVLLGIAAIGTFQKSTRKTNIALIMGTWAFLFLNQGPIYAPLVIAAALVMIALRMRLAPAALMVLLASYYVHESRWIWSYAPGLWAGLSALALLKKPSLRKRQIKELIRPLTLGLSGLIGGRVLPILIPQISTLVQQIIADLNSTGTGGVDSLSIPQNIYVQILPSISSAATRQPLLWARLLPNSTYGPGILLGIIWVALPLIIVLVCLIIKKHWKLNWLQIISALVILSSFLAVGLTASVKIGGGSNLHNLDMFLITLLILAALAAVSLIDDQAFSREKGFWPSVLVSLILVFPITYTLRTTEKPQLPEPAVVQESLDMIKSKLADVGPDDEILFIDHRQLLTFNIVSQVPLVDDYEKKKLMNEAMGANEAYFQPFYDDIANHRFALIINEPLNVLVRGEDYAFGDENDAFVKWVTKPLFCTYEPVYTNHETGVELLVPREEPPDDLASLCESIFDQE